VWVSRSDTRAKSSGICPVTIRTVSTSADPLLRTRFSTGITTCRSYDTTSRAVVIAGYQRRRYHQRRYRPSAGHQATRWNDGRCHSPHTVNSTAGMVTTRTRPSQPNRRYSQPNSTAGPVTYQYRHAQNTSRARPLTSHHSSTIQTGSRMIGVRTLSGAGSIRSPRMTLMNGTSPHPSPVTAANSDP
jgi:hypothetical protein